MKNSPSTLLFMQELQALRTEMAELKLLSIKQTELLEKMSLAADKVPELAPENTYTPEKMLHLRITEMIQEFRIPANLKGYSLLREAIKLAYNDMNMLRVTKCLYPALAKEFQTTVERVERSIRHAIGISYDKYYDHPLYQKCFVDYQPTNAQFISTVVDQLKVEDEMNAGFQPFFRPMLQNLTKE